MAISLAYQAFRDSGKQYPPEIAIGLGSGMGDVTAGLEIIQRVSFGDIPGLGRTSVSGHKGYMTLGNWVGKNVLVFEGRVHFYEAHDWDKVVLPIRIAHELKVKQLLLTNAAGGIRADLHPGSFMPIQDHIEWNRQSCWRHPGPGSVGGDRPSPYSSRLVSLLQETGQRLGRKLNPGIYASVTGPSYETLAEVRALKAWGADAVGMSTTREILAGYELGMQCAALSCITNRAAGLGDHPLDHSEVLVTAAAQSRFLAKFIEEFLRAV